MTPILAGGNLEAISHASSALGLDEEEPAELLLGLRERAVSGGHLAALDADGPGRAGRLEGSETM